MGSIISKAETDNQAYIQERERLLSRLASRNNDAFRRYNQKPDDIRTHYWRDADRIIHSHAYTRYIDKTQVFYLVNNDHITHRVLHVQLVSKIARTIGRSLRLNEDLIEAIALGHDIGHIPYGHTGEACLSEICAKAGIGPFLHNVQSVRFLDVIEDCDLTMQVLDGILCHNGEQYDHCLKPDTCNDWGEFDNRRDLIQSGAVHIAPMTLEGCVVRFADTIAYIGRDIQDAREVCLIDENDELPADVVSVIGSDNRNIIHKLIMNLIENSDSRKEGIIAYSDEYASALRELKRYNYEHIYHNEKLTSERPKIRNMYRTVFDTLLSDLRDENRESMIYSDFINSGWVSERYKESASPEEKVRDFVAGMTDRYFEARFREMVLPEKVEGRFGDTKK